MSKPSDEPATSVSPDPYIVFSHTHLLPCVLFSNTKRCQYVADALKESSKQSTCHYCVGPLPGSMLFQCMGRYSANFKSDYNLGYSAQDLFISIIEGVSNSDFPDSCRQPLSAILSLSGFNMGVSHPFPLMFPHMAPCTKHKISLFPGSSSGKTVFKQYINLTFHDPLCSSQDHWRISKTSVSLPRSIFE